MVTSDAPTSGRNSGLPAWLGRAHDWLTWASFQLAVVCLGIISVSFCYEVVARYGFNAPTTWANPLVSYLLCALIFLAMPEMTRTSTHISINLLIDALPKGVASLLNQIIRAIGVVSCLLGAWICGSETVSQIAGDIWTISYFPVPKWLISSFIPYGFISSGIYFLRQIFGDRATADTRGVDV